MMLKQQRLFFSLIFTIFPTHFHNHESAIYFLKYALDQAKFDSAHSILYWQYFCLMFPNAFCDLLLHMMSKKRQPIYFVSSQIIHYDQQTQHAVASSLNRDS